MLEALGYRVLTAADGAQAVSVFALNRDKVALVLTDMMMPVMDGPTTIVALRQIDPRIKIIAASGLDANGNVAKAAHVGVKHFLAKPYTTQSLLVTLRNVLREKA
jgi:CheY-like chemotaxis protein